MKRALLALMLAAVASPPVYAQIAGAIGKPLAAGDFETGTISVRIVAGSPASPVNGTEVTLMVNGTPQIARTDDAGRAFFKNLTPGAQVQAKAKDEDGKDITSDVFPVPAQGGARVMLTTRPWNPGAGMAGGGAGGAGGVMPNPRQMSGQARPEDQDPPGSLTVRLAYDDFKDTPANVPVALVGYHANDAVDMQVVASDKDGRATFKALDRTGATSYYAMTLLERNNTLDRLISMPITPDARTGMRAMLSSEKRASTEPVIDDLNRLEKQTSAPPAGKVRVIVEGGVEPSQPVSLVEITPEGKRVFATAKPTQGAPDPSDVDVQPEFNPNVDMKPGTVTVVVHGGAGNADAAMSGVSVHAAPADKAATAAPADGATDASGVAALEVDPKAGAYMVTLTINGRTVTTQPFELTESGGVLDVGAHWSNTGKWQIEADLTPRPGQVFFAETTMHGQLYRSAPFQPVPDRGTRISILVFPRVLFQFSVQSRVDDEYLAVSGRFTLSNNSFAPYVGGPDGMIVPLPKGFRGGLVGERDQADVAVVPGEGFRIARPLAPGSRSFGGAFSLPVEDGSVHWALDLPFGSFNSGMEILQVPGMYVQTSGDLKARTEPDERGSWSVLYPISILPKQSMVMSIIGLPQPPAWKIWLPRIAAALVVMMMLGGITFALVRPKKPSDAERKARRGTLLDELVELERSGKNNSRREQVIAELESLWDEG